MTANSEQTVRTTGPATEVIEAEVLKFLELKTKKSWQPDVDLFAAGGVSSLFAMEIVVFLEQSFDIAIVGADLKLDNFRTVRLMAGLVRRLRESGEDGHG